MFQKLNHVLTIKKKKKRRVSHIGKIKKTHALHKIDGILISLPISSKMEILCYQIKSRFLKLVFAFRL